MARTRQLQVVISGDAKDLNRAFGQVEDRSEKVRRRLIAVGAAATGALLVGLTKSAQAAIEAEKSQARLEAQLKASGISYRGHAKQIDDVIQKHSRLSGLDDEDLQDAFTNIVRITKDVDKGLRLTGLAADFARAKHIDVAKAGEIVGKVAGGNTGILSRYGIQIDKGASSTEALGKLQETFSGQAEKYGKTTAGSMDRASVSAENLGETVGAKVTPLIGRLADALNNLIGWADRNRTAATALAVAVGTLGAALAIAGTINRVAAAMRTLRAAVIAVNIAMRANPIGLVVTVLAALGTGLVVAYRRSERFRAIVDTVARTLRNGLLGALDGVLGGLSSFLTAIGKAARAVGADGLARSAEGGARAIDKLRDQLEGAKDKSTEATRALDRTRRAIEKLPDRKRIEVVAGVTVRESRRNRADQADEFARGNRGPRGDGPGQQIDRIVNRGVQRVAQTAVDRDPTAFIPGLGALPSGKGAGSLMGAGAHLAPFAAIAARFGLRVSSGLRPGAVTSSGRPSHHASGNAIDLAGSPTGMMRAFQYLKRFAGRLAELIYTPGGAFSNGRAYRPTGQLAADHYDHIHLAFRGGRGDGIGDGPGGRAAKAMGPLSMIADAAQKYGIDPAILYGVWGAESNFSKGPGPTSPAGARGPFQFMPGTAKAYGINPGVFSQAVYAAAKYLGTYKGRGIAGMLAAYNAGPAGNPNNAETRAYIPKVQSIARRWARVAPKDADSGAKRSAGGGGEGEAKAVEAEKVTPYEASISARDLAIAESGGGEAQARALVAKSNVIGRRINKIRKDLATPGKIKRASKRVALRQELAQLIGEQQSIAGEVYTLRHPESPDTGLGGEGEEDEAARQRHEEMMRQLEESRRAQEEHAAAIRDNTAAMNAQTAFAQSVQSTESNQLKKWVADIVSSQVVGRGVVGRSFTPGSGVEFSY